MLLGDLAGADPGVLANPRAIDISGLSADSRLVKPGFLFAALSGASADGAVFAADAVDRGAVVILAAIDAEIEVPSDIAVIRSDDPQRTLALFAARFHPAQPERMVAVTGTSGKTSVVEFARQILAAAGREAASIGTLGIVTSRATRPGGLTTPDPVALHAELDRLARGGVSDAAIEASSHGLDQRRLDGLRLEAAGFTNLGRDHLDYHRDEADYMAAKLRLFSDILPADGTVVIDMDDKHAQAVASLAGGRGQKVMSVGRKGTDIRLVRSVADGFGQRVELNVFGLDANMTIPLAGTFQVSNALMAVGLAIAVGVEADAASASLEGLNGAPGRLEFVGRKANGAMVFVDYAHKPEALVHALSALRPMTENRLVIVFGAGGDRDPGKRPLMGRAAAAGADHVIVTDDNPRSEDPAAIRRAIVDAAPGAMEIGDRGAAVAQAVAMLGPGDVLCVAGKGHETGQIIGDRSIPYSDHEAVRAALAGEAA